MRFYYEGTDFIPLLLHYLGTFEPAVVEQIRRLAKPGDTVLDVGANIGFHTLESWHAVGNMGRVISIEASSKHAAAIRRNLGANNLPTGDVINVAVGDHDGEVTLSLPEGGNQGMFGINAGNDEAFTIPLRRIDDLLCDLSRLSVIKMDIEGSELWALQGAAKTIRRHKPAILVEINDGALARCGASSAEVVQLLSEFGYAGTVINGGARVRGTEPHECDECLFLPVDGD
jgi:FkbM family methyltransferase